MKKYDVAIIGAGPIGLEMAVVLKEIGISYIQFDKAQIGQTIFDYPLSTHFFSSTERIGIANLPIQTIDQQRCSREQYLAYLRSVVLGKNLIVNTYEEVINLKKVEEFFLITTKSNKGEQSYIAKYIILATGGMAKHRTLNIPGESLPHVFSTLGDPHRFFKKNVVVVGGKNSAVEAALRCYHCGALVSLIVRQESLSKSVKYWLLPEIESRIKKKQIDAYFKTTLQEIANDHVKIQTDQHISLLPADFVIKAIGFESDNSLFEKLKIPTHSKESKPIFNDETMETTVPNIFVCGTSIGGTQTKYEVFIENSHEHVNKIAKELASRLHIPHLQSSMVNEPRVDLPEQ
ncbi:MAG: hypothetical protein BGO10_03245 [Chlamydia sp. 32-24]|nr:MAG: hypothetical protein BGO10_03245 [Chlamydia sp. 32-24]